MSKTFGISVSPETTPPTTIYTGDGTITSDRIVDLDGHTLLFQDVGNDLLRLSSDFEGTVAALEGSLTIDETTFFSQVRATTNPTNSRAQLYAEAGEKSIEIEGRASVTTSTLEYTADLHTFNGQVKIVDGTQAAGYVFTSDADGLGSWQEAGGGTTIYTGDGTLAGDRIVDLDGHTLSFGTGADDNRILINPGVIARMTVRDPTDDGNEGNLQTTVSDIMAGFNMYAIFNDGAKQTQIQGFADATTSTLTYTADSHIMNVGGAPWLSLNATAFTSIMTAIDGDAESFVKLVAEESEPVIFFQLNATDGVFNTVDITGDAAGAFVSITAPGEIDLLAPVTVMNFASINHIVGSGSAPSIAAGAGAGTSPTVSVGSGSTDIAGFLNITTGTLPTGTNATVATITFNTAFGDPPSSIILTPANALTALLTGLTMVFVDQASTTTTTFIIVSGTTALTAATAYKFFYQVIQ